MSDEFFLGRWQVFPSEQRVSDGESRVKLEPKAMDLLLVLIEAQGEVVSREVIFEKVWRNQIIADHVLYNLIANLRKILEEDPHHPTMIMTVPKKGYRLIAPPQTSKQKTPAQSSDDKTSTLFKGLSAALLSVIAIFVIVQFVSVDSLLESSDQAPIAHQQAPTPSIAVLPFDVFHAHADTHYFADGLAEEIIHQLTVIPELAVTARTSSFAFRDKGLDIPALADKLNVAYLLEGSVRKDQNTMRITVQLIEARDSSHLWSKVFTVEEDDIFTLQHDISLAVVQSLAPGYALQSSGKLRKHPELGDAYMHFLRGSAMAAKATPDYIQKALAEFKQAVALQPEYALAHIAIAMNTMVMYQHRLVESELARSTAQAAIDQALAIEPYMPEAFAAQGLLHINFNRFSEAEQAFTTALELNPKLAIAHHNYGYLLWIQDKHEQALTHFQVALTQNPMSAITNFAVADSLFITGQLTEALKQYLHCVGLLPDYPACRLGLANFYRFTQQQNAATEHMQLARQQLPPDNIYMITAEAVNHFWLGEYAQAKQQQQAIELVKGGGYLELQLKLLISMQANEQTQWLWFLEQQAGLFPDNLSIKLALGLNYYYQQDCTRSLAYYETALSEDIFLRGKFNVMAWGVSHLANMAYCFEQQKSDKKQRILDLLTEQIKQFDTGDFNVPGVEFVKAKLAMLSNQPQLANQILQSETIQTWQLNWLLQCDPLLAPLI